MPRDGYPDHSRWELGIAEVFGPGTDWSFLEDPLGLLSGGTTVHQPFPEEGGPCPIAAAYRSYVWVPGEEEGRRPMPETTRVQAPRVAVLPSIWKKEVSEATKIDEPPIKEETWRDRPSLL